MTLWLLDTNVVAELARAKPDPRVEAWGLATDERSLFLSILTLAEIDKGIAKLPADDPRRPRYEATLRAIEKRFAGRIVGLDDATVRRWGHLAGDIARRTGNAPPVIDGLLAATAIEHDLCLVTRNTRDVAHTGARLFNPWVEIATTT